MIILLFLAVIPCLFALIADLFSAKIRDMAETKKSAVKLSHHLNEKYFQ